MTNIKLEEYNRKEVFRLNNDLQSKQHITSFMCSQEEMRMNLLDATDDVSISIHPLIANTTSKEALHNHDFFELIYMYKGNATQYFQNSCSTLTEGSLCLLNTNVMHGISIENEEHILFNILIRPRLLTQTFFSLIADNDLLNSFFINSLFQEDNAEYILFDYSVQSNAEPSVQSLIEEFIEKKPCFQAAMKSYLLLLFTELLRNHIHHLESAGPPTGFHEILNYIHDNLITVTLGSTAEHFHYHPNYLSKLFRQYTKRSFSEIVQELKLEQTSGYLRNTSLSIDSIVELMGYYDRSYFNKVFKKRFGMGPKEYRSQKYER